MTKRALVLIDVQNDYFPGGKWPLVAIDSAADNAARVLAAARQAGDLVVHVRHEFTSADAPFFTPGSEGARIHEKVGAQRDEPVVLKHHVNAFRETDLKTLLDRHGVDEVVICGAMSHMCVDAGVRAASDLGYKCVVVHDACATRDQEFAGTVVLAADVHAAFMAALGFGYAKVVSTDEYLNSPSADGKA
jgi:nicotinamidase-related amidase